MKKLICYAISVLLILTVLLACVSCDSRKEDGRTTAAPGTGSEATGELPAGETPTPETPADGTATTTEAPETEDPRPTFYVDVGAGNEDGTDWASDRGILWIGDDTSHRVTGFHEGDKVVVKAEAKEGYTFVSWVVLWKPEKVLSTEREFELTVTGDMNLMALFASTAPETSAPETAAPGTEPPTTKEPEAEFYVDVGAGNEDGTDWASDRGILWIGDDTSHRVTGFHEGDKVVVKAEAKEGYTFVSWVVLWKPEKVLSTESEFELTVTGNMNLMALFAVDS